MTPVQLEELSKVFLIAGQNLPVIGVDGKNFDHEKVVLSVISKSFKLRAESVRQKIVNSVMKQQAELDIQNSLESSDVDWQK